MADPRADAAVSAGLDVLTSDQPGVPHQALRHEFRMLYQVGGVSNHTRHEDLPLRELHVFPDAPFMLVAHVRSLDGIRLRLDLEDNIGDVAQGDIVDMRPMATAPTEVQAHVVFRQTREGVVNRLYQHFDVLTVLRHGHIWEELPGGRELRLVNLEDEAGVGDCLVLLAQGLSGSEEESLLAGIVAAMAVIGDSYRQVQRCVFGSLLKDYRFKCCKLLLARSAD